MPDLERAIATRLLAHRRGQMPKQQNCPTKPHTLSGRSDGEGEWRGPNLQRAAAMEVSLGR
jgi:hypothetical protein